LLTNATVVDDAIRLVESKLSSYNLKLSVHHKEENEAVKNKVF
jgi:hypothetical protein